jgi:hypothetical protein
LRFAQGGGNALQQPSRFLGELPKELVDEWNLRPTFDAYAERAPSPARPGFGESDADPVDPGDEPF